MLSETQAAWLQVGCLYMEGQLGGLGSQQPSGTVGEVGLARIPWLADEPVTQCGDCCLVVLTAAWSKCPS